MRLYADLAPWFHLLTHPSSYEGEADFYKRVIDATTEGKAQTLLELGSGGGNNASYLKKRFACTLTDLSEEMLALSRTINPECEHILGDMRTLRLGRTFDAVFLHDAVMYMTTESDLRSTIETAAVHTRPGGVTLLVPDTVRETFTPTVDHGGHDGPDGRALRYLEWTYDPDPKDTTFEVEFAIMLREPGTAVRVEHDHHTFGLYPRSVWVDVLCEAGLEPVDVDVADPDAGEHELFVARKPA